MLLQGTTVQVCLASRRYAHRVRISMELESLCAYPAVEANFHLHWEQTVLQFVKNARLELSRKHPQHHLAELVTLANTLLSQARPIAHAARVATTTSSHQHRPPPKYVSNVRSERSHRYQKRRHA